MSNYWKIHQQNPVFLNKKENSNIFKFELNFLIKMMNKVFEPYGHWTQKEASYLFSVLQHTQSFIKSNKFRKYDISRA